MKIKVKPEGLLIPKELLLGVEEVEVRKENNTIIITTLTQDDPIFGLGSNPVNIEVSDASENHDLYIYKSE